MFFAICAGWHGPRSSPRAGLPSGGVFGRSTARPLASKRSARDADAENDCGARKRPVARIVFAICLTTLGSAEPFQECRCAEPLASATASPYGVVEVPVCRPRFLLSEESMGQS